MQVRKDGVQAEGFILVVMAIHAMLLLAAGPDGALKQIRSPTVHHLHAVMVTVGVGIIAIIQLAVR